MHPRVCAHMQAGEGEESGPTQHTLNSNQQYMLIDETRGSAEHGSVPGCGHGGDLDVGFLHTHIEALNGAKSVRERLCMSA